MASAPHEAEAAAPAAAMPGASEDLGALAPAGNAAAGTDASAKASPDVLLDTPATAAPAGAPQQSAAPQLPAAPRQSNASSVAGPSRLPASPADAPSPSHATMLPASSSNVSLHALPRRSIERVFFGAHNIKTWYASPFPLDDDPHETTPAGSPSLSHQPAKRGGNKRPRLEAASRSSSGSVIGAPANGAAAAPAALSTPGPHPGGALASTSAGTPASVVSSTESPTAAVRQRGAAAAQPPGASTGRSLWVCDGCFKYARTYAGYRVHKKECTFTHPPGRKVYQRGAHIIWEVDGAEQKLYAQNLSLFGKLFIDHKAIYFDVEPFLFYVLTDASPHFDHPIGFFSKEKISYDDYNLACIITFPPFQKRGFGTLLIEFSYYLSANDTVPGTPERPLSSLGFRGYLAYWSSVVLRTLALAFDETDPDFSQLLLAPPPSASTPVKGATVSPAVVAAARARQVHECTRIRRALLGLPALSDTFRPLSGGDAEEEEIQRRKIIRVAKGFAGVTPRGLATPSRSERRATRAGNRAGSQGSPSDAQAPGPVKTESSVGPPDDLGAGRTREGRRAQGSAPAPDAHAKHPALAIAIAPGASISLATTLGALSAATRLRVDDVAFALAECGLLRWRVPPAVVQERGVYRAHPSGDAARATKGTAELPVEAALLITRDAVRKAIQAKNVKRPVLDDIYVLV